MATGNAKDFLVNILADGTKADKTFDAFGTKAGKTLGSVGSAFKGFAGIAGGALAAIGLDRLGQKTVEFLSGSIEAYKESQTAQTLLTDAYARFPKVADVTLESLHDLNTELGKKTQFDDDATASGMAVLAQFNLTGEQLKTLTPLMQDYAAKTGKDLPTAAKQLGQAVFGQGKALKEIGVKFKDTGSAAGNFEQLVGSLNEKVGGFAEKEGKNAAGQSEILKNQLGEVQETIGGKLLPIIQEFTGFLLENVVPGLATVADWVMENTGLLAGLAGGAVILGLGFGAVNLAMTVAASGGITKWLASTKLVTAAQWLWNAALTANPIGLIITAIAALVAGLVWFFTQTDAGREIWSNFTQFLGEAWENVVGWFTDVGDGLSDWWNGLWNGIVKWVGDAFKFIAGLFLNFHPLGIIIKNWGPISSFFVSLWNGIISFISGVWTTFAKWITSAANAYIAGWRNIFNGFRSWFGSLWSGLVDGVRTIWAGFVNWISGVANAYIAGWRGIFNGFRTWFGGLWTGLVDGVRTIWAGFVNWISAAANGWIAVWRGIFNGLGNWWGGFWKGIGSTVAGVGNWIASAFNNVVGFVSGLPGRIGSAASGMWNGITNAFRKAINWVIGMWNGLSFKIPSLDFMGMHIGGFTLRVPYIPYLAAGGVTRAETLAVIGDNPGGREVVEPLDSYKRELAKERDAAVKAMSGGKGGAGLTIENHFHERVSGADISREAVWQWKVQGGKLA